MKLQDKVDFCLEIDIIDSAFCRVLWKIYVLQMHYSKSSTGKFFFHQFLPTRLLRCVRHINVIYNFFSRAPIQDQNRYDQPSQPPLKFTDDVFLVLLKCIDKSKVIQRALCSLNASCNRQKKQLKNRNIYKSEI